MKIVLCTIVITQLLWAFNEREYCSGLVNCMMAQPVLCNDSLSEKNESIEYTPEFCALFTEVEERGIVVESNIGRELYSHLGIEHRVEYVIKGELPISKKMFDFLLSDVPHTALLINAYQETEYSAQYTTFDRKTFFGSNGGSLRGTISEIADAHAQRELLYFGFGEADVLFWSLKGTVLLFFEYKSTAEKEIAYTLRVLVFNRSSVVNGIMDMSLFRSIVHSKIETIITHIQESARQYAAGNYEPIKKYEKLNTELAQEFLRKIERVDQGAPGDTTKISHESTSSYQLQSESSAATAMPMSAQKKEHDE